METTYEKIHEIKSVRKTTMNKRKAKTQEIIDQLELAPKEISNETSL